MKTTHKGRGNRNAAKPPEVKRVTLSLRVLPETRRRLAAIAAGRSLGRAVDEVARDMWRRKCYVVQESGYKMTRRTYVGTLEEAEEQLRKMEAGGYSGGRIIPPEWPVKNQTKGTK